MTVLPAEESSQGARVGHRLPARQAVPAGPWPQAARELGVAGRLADSLGGERDQEPQTVRRGGLRGRLYEIAYEREGVELRQRLTLLLSRRTEYQLLCRWDADADLPEACTHLESSFSVSA